MISSQGGGRLRTRAPVVVITGASAGVGRATARAFASRGASLGLLARGADGLDATRREIEAEGGRAVDIVTDVADARQVGDATATIEEQLGPIDVWVNNAMVSVFMPFKEMSAEDFRRVTEVTYLGYVYGTMEALRVMLPRDRGRIIQVGSALAYRAIPLQSAYCGAKHAIEGFTESLRCELLHDKSNVKLSILQMPALNTPQFHWVKTSLPKHPQPVPPIYQPEVAAEAIVWVADHMPREMNLGWPTSLSVTANKFVPALLDRYLAWRGFESQQADHPIEPRRPDNLWGPLDGDAGAHGEFGHIAKARSLHWWANTHRAALVAASLAAGGAAALRRRG